MIRWRSIWNTYRPQIVQVGIALLAGGVAALLGGDTGAAYAALERPPLSPPGWVFPVVWTVLYVLMGVAAGLVATERSAARGPALLRYYLQLGINVLWPPLFFRYGRITVAAVWLLLLVAAVAVTQHRFYRLRPVAGYLLIPYFLWCLFALYLNVGFAVLN